MSEADELNALKKEISTVAAAQLDAFDARIPQGPGKRDADNGTATVVWLTSNGVGIEGNPANGAVHFKPAPGSPFARLEIGGKTYFSCLSPKTGDFRILHGLSDSPFGRVELSQSVDVDGTRWSLGAFTTGTMIAIDGPGKKIFLSNEGLAESIASLHGYPEPERFTWTLSTTPPDPPPPPPPVPPPQPIRAEAFWWGLHFVIPEALMSDWTHVGITVAKVIDVIASFTGPAAPFVDGFAKYLELEFELAQLVDTGNGVYVSMSWFAPLIFVPTPI